MKPLTTRTILRTALLCGLVSLATASHAADVVKANNADDLNLTTSWTNGVAPDASDVGVWDSTVSAANSTLLATNSSWSGLRIANPGGPVTISATSTNPSLGATLTLGTSGIDLGAATADLTLSNAVALLAANTQTWTVGSGRLITVAGTLTRPSGNSATVNFDTSLGGTITIASGTASVLLLGGNTPYATLNFADYAALDGSKNVVTGIAFYGDYALGVNLSGTYASPILNITGTATGSTQAWRNSNSLTVPNGVRFNVANSQNTRWTVDTSNAGRLLTTGAILIGPGVGAQNVEFNGNGGIRANGNAQDLVLHQNNTAGDLIINTSVNSATGSSASPLVKTGPGRVILNNAGNGYVGPTRIEAGTLLVNGATTGTGAVTVNSGATLGGSGTVNGSITVQAGSTIAAGNENGAGALTTSAGILLNAGTSTLKFYGLNVPVTNTTALLLANGGGITNNATVNVSILAGNVSVGQYPLIRSTNGFSGSGSYVLASIKPHVQGYLSNNVVNQTLDLVVTNVAQPLVWTKGSETWNLTSTNWQDATATATTYQEIGSLGDSVVFEDSLSGGSPITVSLNSTVIPSSVLVSNSTKTYTISGTGSISGGGALTKVGSGTFTSGTVNTFTGGVNLNGGMLVFSQIENLGSNSPVTFGGGTLQYSAANTADISARTVTFGTGGATIDVGANDVTFSSRVGNSGAGGLTKIGSGILALNFTNLYSGDTVISNGTLALGKFSGNLTTIPNSPRIILNSGTTLDVMDMGGFTLSASSSQALSGAGTVAGSLTVPAGTSVSAATTNTVGTLNFSQGLTVSGGTLVLNATTTGNDLLAVEGVFTVNAGSVLTIPSTTLTNGSYKLIQANNGLSGLLSDFTLNYNQSGKAGDLLLTTDGTTNTVLLVVSPSASDNIKWAGVGTDWDLIGTANWLLAATPWAFTNGDIVTFDDSGSAISPTLVAPVKPSVVIVSNTVDYTFSGSGKISGTATLTKLGAGVLNVQTVNDNTGNTTIAAGAVNVSGHLGSGPVTNNAALVFQQPDARTVTSIAGTGSLTQSGSSTLTVSGAANYTGPTIITAGTLTFGTGGASGALSTSAITNDGVMILNSSNNWTLAASDTGTGILTKQGSNTLTWSGVSTRTGETRVDTGKVILGSPNHLQGTVRVESAGILDLNGGDQLLPGLYSTLSAGGLIVNNAGSVTNSLTVSNTTTYDCSAVVQDNQVGSGKISFVKDGTGQLNWRGANTYSGASFIKNGKLRLVTGGAMGTRPVNLTGGGLQFGNGGNVTNVVNLVAPISTYTDEANVNIVYTGPFAGFGDLLVDYSNGNGTFTLDGGVNQFTSLTNTIYLTNGNAGFFRYGSGRGANAVTFDLTDSRVTINSTGTQLIELGALVGNTNSAAIGAAGTSTYVIGAKNLSTTFAGRLNATANNLIKVGSGTLTLTGTNQFTGALTVSNATLVLANDAAPLSMNPVTVAAGATLDVTALADFIVQTNELGEVTNSYYVTNATLALGTGAVAQSLQGGGTVNGNVIIGTNGTVRPGTSIGALTINNALTIDGAAVMELDRTHIATNDLITAASFTATGTLTVTNIGPDLLTSNQFKLFSGPVSGFATINLPVSNVLNTVAYQWQTNLAVDGSILLLSGASAVNTDPTNITAVVAGGNLTLSWPADHTGWTLQVQTNTLAVGLNTNWFNVPGSSTTNEVVMPVGPAEPTVFFRLLYTIP